MKTVFAIFFLLTYSSLSYSYGAANGKVIDVRVDKNGWGMIKFDSPIAHQPASCTSPSYTSHFSFDTNKEGGKAIYSMALMALATGKRVSAFGTGLCEQYSNIVESLSYWHIYEN